MTTTTAPPSTAPEAADRERAHPADVGTGRHGGHADERRTAALVGSLFLLATATFATGNALVSGVFDRPGFLADGADHRISLAAGALLAFVQGVAIVAIAVLVHPVLRRRGQRRLANAYLALRVAEMAATLLYVAAPVVALELARGVRDGTVDAGSARQLEGLLPAQAAAGMLAMYLVVSFGGWALAMAMHRTRLVPRSLALLGLAGYPVLLLGCVLTLVGVADVERGAGTLALVP